MKLVGKRPARYCFFLNPYADARFTVCPRCAGRTRARKLPLLIHVEPRTLLALNKTCRFCAACDLLIAHEDELNAMLLPFVGDGRRQVSAGDYLVLGTLDRADWRRGTRVPLPTPEAIERLHEFAEVVQFKPSPGWAP